MGRSRVTRRSATPFHTLRTSKPPDRSFWTKAIQNMNRPGKFIDVKKIYISEILSSSSNEFKGACLDIGAEKSVIGRKQAMAYCKFTGCKFKHKPSRTFFRFGDGCFSSIGIIPVRIPCPDGSFIHFNIDVVQEDVPMLIGLDILDREKLVADNVSNVLSSKRFGWELPITRKDGHLFLTWDYSTVLYTKSELKKLHYHFFHPTSQKLFDLISRAKLEHATPETRSLLQQISASCKTCQHFTPRPQTFKVSFPKNVVFNSVLALDLMYIRQQPILHVVDLSTNFSAARILPGQSVQGVWSAFLQCWVSVYPGYPDVIKTDQGSVFTSSEFLKLSTMAGVKIELSGVESHNSLSAGEKYHDPLRRIYEKILFDNPSMPPDFILSTAVKSMNDKMNCDGLFPSLLVFGVLPRFPSFRTALPNQTERMRALSAARTEMETITSELRLSKALLTALPAATKQVFKAGQEVLVFREKERVRWTGPYKITKIHGKQAFIDRDGTEVQHTIEAVHQRQRGSKRTVLFYLAQLFFAIHFRR